MSDTGFLCNSVTGIDVYCMSHLGGFPVKG